MPTRNPGEQKPYEPVSGGQLRYLLYVPSNFIKVDEKWPGLCFLHGKGEAAKNGDEKQSNEVLMNHGSPPWHCAINSPLIQGFIVVSPQRPNPGRWTQRDFEEVTQILRTIYENFRGDPKRSYLTGFSYGGQAVFDFVHWAEALSEKDPSKRVEWAALWPVDDASDQPRKSCNVKRIWLHFGTWKPGPHNSTFKNLNLSEVGAFRNGHPHADHLYTDYGPFDYNHTATCVAAYADWRVYEWLLS